MRNLGWGCKVSCVSGKNNSLLSSNKRLRFSSISERAKFNSSRITQCPLRIAYTNNPS